MSLSRKFLEEMAVTSSGAIAPIESSLGSGSSYPDEEDDIDDETKFGGKVSNDQKEGSTDPLGIAKTNSGFGPSNSGQVSI